MKNKVYCKNCKYINWPYIYPRCSFAREYIINCVGIKYLVKSDELCTKLNADFHCNNYKRRNWWNWWSVK